MMEKSLELVHLLDRFKRVRAFVFDVDGVFTDNRLLITEQGEFLRTMNVRDGQALKWAIQAGFPICIITGGTSRGVVERFRRLGVTEIYTNIQDKFPVFRQFLDQYQLAAADVCYMGDDLPDLPVLRKVGLPACPVDAIPEVLDTAAYVSPRRGGDTCVRDLLEKVMKLQDKWPEY